MNLELEIVKMVSFYGDLILVLKLIFCPGVHNLTTKISDESGYTQGNYTDFSGTSFVTPIIAGAASLFIVYYLKNLMQLGSRYMMPYKTVQIKFQIKANSLVKTRRPQCSVR